MATNSCKVNTKICADSRVHVSPSIELFESQNRSNLLCKTQALRASFLLAVTFIGIIALAQPPQSSSRRRGPPRGPIKSDRSHYFGKEGDYQNRRPTIPMPTVFIAVLIAVFLVAIKMYVKPAPADATTKSK